MAWTRRRLVLVLSVCLLVFLLVVIGWYKGYFKSNENNHSISIEQNTDTDSCGLNLYFPVGENQLKYTNCGYLYSTDDGTIDYFLGRLEVVNVNNGLTTVKIGLGKDMLTAVLGSTDENSQVLVTLVGGQQVSPYLSNQSPVSEWVHLNGVGIGKLEQYIGKYILFNAYSGSEETYSQMRQAQLNHPENKVIMQTGIDYLRKCGVFEAAAKNYYAANNLGMNINKPVDLTKQDCGLYGQGIYVYQ